jgi:peptide-methionine (S)-S-oxide reductase
MKNSAAARNSTSPKPKAPDRQNMRTKFIAAAALCVATLAARPACAQNVKQNEQPAGKSSPDTQLATFGGGCFWCMEAVFERLDGVKHLTSGYSGGHTENPTYKQVCNGDTGHAEVIQIEFDPQKISYEKLLDVFWHAHDPTTLNRQGADHGEQYRSIILYHNDGQRLAAEKSKSEAAAKLSDPIVTQIVPLKKFYPAEDYHQGYFRANPAAPYCNLVIRPKLEKLKKAGEIP